MGADCLVNFHLWKNWQKIIDQNNILVVDRGDFFHKSTRSKAFIYAKGKINFLKEVFLLSSKLNSPSDTETLKNSNIHKVCFI